MPTDVTVQLQGNTSLESQMPRQRRKMPMNNEFRLCIGYKTALDWTQQKSPTGSSGIFVYIYPAGLSSTGIVCGTINSTRNSNPQVCYTIPYGAKNSMKVRSIPYTYVSDSVKKGCDRSVGLLPHPCPPPVQLRLLELLSCTPKYHAHDIRQRDFMELVSLDSEHRLVTQSPFQPTLLKQGKHERLREADTNLWAQKNGKSVEPTVALLPSPRGSSLNAPGLPGKRLIESS